MNRVILLFSFFCLGLTPLFAQQPSSPVTEQEARAELRRRGVDEDEVIRRLEEQGYNIDNLDPNEIDIIEFQRVLEETIAEIEAEQATEEAQAMLRDTVPMNQQRQEPPAVEPDTVELETEEEPEEPAVARIYGHRLFEEGQLPEFKRSLDAKPPETYVLGPGDELTVLIFGVSQIEQRYTINSEGFINLGQNPGSPNIRIYLKGIDLAQARDLLRNRFSRFYQFRPNEFAVSVNYARDITVNIVGNVSKPSSYNFPALNTAFNALSIAGGINAIGSVRNIDIIRGTERKRLDVYEYLLNPAVANDYFLQNNDYIYVPVANKVVEIQGAVRRPMRYELLDNENLIQLIEYAGGLKDNAYRNSIQVRRYLNDREEIIDVNLRELLESGEDFALIGGDRVVVREIPRPYQNFVSAQGAVELPGRYQFTEGMQIADLLDKSGLRPEARTDVAYLKRLRPDSTIQYRRLNLQEILDDPNVESNLSLRPEDQLQVYFQKRYTDGATISVEGAVREPIELPFENENDLRVEDAIILAGGLKLDAYNIGFVVRRDPETMRQSDYIQIDVRDAIDNPATSQSNIPLEPYDLVQVFSNKVFTDSFTVNVQGAVRRPGTYVYDEDLTLRDVLTLAGGLKLEASIDRVEIFRIIIQEGQPTQTVAATLEVDRDLNVLSGTGEFPLQPFDLVVVRQLPDFELLEPVLLQGEVQYPGTYALISDNERLFDLIERAGGLSNEAFPGGATLYRTQDSIGFVIMELQEALEDVNSRHNYLLKEGDIIYIPKQQDLVTITGATRADELYPDRVVQGGFNVAYNKGKNAKYYIDKYAAGIGKDGKASLVTVEQPNGQIDRTKNFLLFKIYPGVEQGATINVGRKPEKPQDEGNEQESNVDWGKVVANSIAQATSVLSLILLVQRVSN